MKYFIGGCKICDFFSIGQTGKGEKYQMLISFPNMNIKRLIIRCPLFLDNIKVFQKKVPLLSAHI